MKSLNQITGRSVPGFVNVLGTAKTNATVTLWGDNGAFSATSRKGDYFRGELAATNTASALWLSITNLAVLNNGASADIVTNTVGKMFVPKTPEVFYYDLDGNLTNDGRWVYAWDAENRLTQVESLSSNPTASKRKVVWEFDGKGRRVRQTTSDKSSGSYVVTEDLKFVADGWRHIAELNATNNALVRSYTWGKDLSGSLDGAGGVGGLLMLNSVANGSHFYAYDGNGNVAALVKATDGSISQQCEYEPFGKLLRNTGLMAGENKFLFSTKRNDATTDLLLYEYRVLKTETGTWGSRDPIGEDDGANIYAICQNSLINNWDVLGLFSFTMKWEFNVDPKNMSDGAAADVTPELRKLKIIDRIDSSDRSCSTLVPESEVHYTVRFVQGVDPYDNAASKDNSYQYIIEHEMHHVSITSQAMINWEDRFKNYRVCCPDRCFGLFKDYVFAEGYVAWQQASIDNILFDISQYDNPNHEKKRADRQARLQEAIQRSTQALASYNACKNK